jgi:hypothetical protein
MAIVMGTGRAGMTLRERERYVVSVDSVVCTRADSGPRLTSGNRDPSQEHPPRARGILLRPRVPEMGDCGP